MKKHLFSLALMLLCFTTGAFAQYEKGDITANLGLSMGVWSYGWGYGGSSGFLPIYANVEYSVNDKVAVGPYLGYYGRNYKSAGASFRHMTFGARGTFHASEFLSEALDLDINEEKVDVYASLMMGFETYTWKYTDSWFGSDRASETQFDFGTIIGMRYNFTPQVGAFIELGRGSYGLATIGGSVKF